MNGDGKADLAVSNLDTVTVLLGNGDGTFAPVGVAPSTGNEPVSVAVGDFNGDGIPDLATVNYAGSDLTILLGKGDGSFAPAPVSPATGISPTALAVGDWNGDGIWDLVAPNSQNAQNGMITDTVSVFVAENQMATTASTAVSLPAGTGTHSVIASYPGNSAYGPGISKPVSLLAPRGNPQISFECSPSPADYGVPVTFTATLTSNGSVPTGWVRFMSGTHAYGMAQLNSSGVATEQYTFLEVNQFSMKAIYAGDGDFNPVTSSAVDLVIQKATQIIDFPSPGTRVYLGSGPIALEATTTSGLPIAYDVTGPASVSGSTLTLLGTGAVGITARQNGDDDYQPAKPVEHTIVVVPAVSK